ncbi:MAG TPA: hypothetical protein PK400_10570 [Phycisphaerales bacterium]|nr:hypothetical protein [Phycisphaerales bacterium]
MGADLQVQGGMFGVAAFLNELSRSFPANPDLDQFGGIGVCFAEVGTQAALTVMDREHGESPSGLIHLYSAIVSMEVE